MRFVHLLLFFILFQNILLADITSEIKQIKQLESQIQNINNFLNNPNNLWIKKYSNYKSYQQISFNISKAQEEIQKLQNLPKTIENQTQLNNLQRNLIVLQNQINLLGNYKDT
ncbi:MAG TPA: mechanosensitive ion channel family protein, partial [Candidatus Scatomorpha intestinipullorum]|nr:mechanosensitive ion channel family protein [Candidatus Scatomorpha intestinipullorum]